MPRKNQNSRPQETIDEAVKRYMDGEPAAVVAKYYKISKPGLYLWIKRYKEQMLANSKRSDMTPKERELTDKRTLIAELQSLKHENAALRNKVVTLMIKAGEL